MDRKLTAYAKSNPIETLKEHTERLLKNLNIFRNYYENDLIKRAPFVDNNLWNILSTVCLYHDIGKIISPFQIKIRKSIISSINKEIQNISNIEEINNLKEEIELLEKNNKIYEDIPHNLISPFFVYPVIKDFASDVKTIIIKSIAYHHYQSKLDDMIQEDFLSIHKDDIEEDILHNLYMLKNLIENIDFSSKAYNFYKRWLRNDSKGKFIFIKGLLHRLDHSASAHLPVEIERISNPKELLLNYLQAKCKKRNIQFDGLKAFQKEAEKHRNENILLTASTGTGKTEFAINWIGNDKAFYTLPLRVSVNAMYERFEKIFSGKKVGLLHSDSLLYGLAKINNKFSECFSDSRYENSLEKYIHNVKIARQFAMPLTITTADQLFTSVFKWKGYEKIYATLMYSKVILDEPQCYSPDTLAMIIKALEEIAELGGRFCFMSATIHPFVKEKLSKYCKDLGPFINPENKHKIRLIDQSIDTLIDKIEATYNQGEKVLVIANTVKKAQELYMEISGNKKLLHSGFIQKDRRIKERQIQDDYINNKPVIWITTQIVEASLDIDYDILFTEIASIDALLQRMGRIFRGAGRYIEDSNEPNVIIAADKPSDNYYIYDKEVVKQTLNALLNFNNQVLRDNDKIGLMDKVYGDKDNVSGFYDKFDNAYEILKNGFEVDSSGEAKKLFRNISNMTIIPLDVYEANNNRMLIDNAVESISKNRGKLSEIMNALKTINDYTVSLPIYKAKKVIDVEIKKGIFLAHIDYDNDIGIVFNNKIDNEYGRII